MHPYRLLAASVAAAALVGTTAASASAHVRVTPDSTTAGGYSQLTFRVPDESADARTVKVEIQLPQDHPFLSVSTLPLPGWTASVTDAKLPEPVVDEGTTITKAARTVTWTAETGPGIRPGEYQVFSVWAGPLPRSGTVTLPATQTYSDGTVVHWDQPTPTSGQEPEHPAPSFQVTAAHADAAPTASSTSDPGSSDGTARWLAGGALLAALTAMALGALALVSSRRGLPDDGVRT